MTSEPMTSPAEELPANTVIPAEPESNLEKAQDPRELLAELRSRFEVFRAFQPLAIGIDKAIRSHFPEADRKTLRIALSMHTHCNRYLRLLAKAEQRFDLDGQPVAEVSEEHRQFATTALEERLQRQANEQGKLPARHSKPSDRTAGKRVHPKQQAGNAQPDNPAGSEVSSAPARDSAEKPESKKFPEKPRRKKHKVEHKVGKNTANAASNDTKAQLPTTTLAEKLALLTEKFGRK